MIDAFCEEDDDPIATPLTDPIMPLPTDPVPPMIDPSTIDPPSHDHSHIDPMPPVPAKPMPPKESLED